MPQLIIDPGHGGTDPGAQANGFIEKVLNMEATNYQLKRFKELGIDAETTRTGDATLNPTPRTNKVKDSGAKICLSNHYNAGGGEGCETIHSIYSKGELAKEIANELVEAGEPLRRVFSRKGRSGDYYYMHRLTGSVETVIIEYAFLDNKKDADRIKDKKFREKLYEAVVKAVCTHLKVKYDKSKSKPKKEAATKEIKTDVEKTDSDYKGVSLKSKVDGLRFYNAPSWEDTDLYGRVNEGQGFPEVVAKYKVDGAHQYKVKNSKGHEFFITAAEKYVEVEGASKPSAPKKPKPSPKTLKRGDRGAAVKQMQKDLASVYFYPEKGAKNNGIDGVFGPKTENAVKRFQSAHGLKQDGVFGPKTRAALNKAK